MENWNAEQTADARPGRYYVSCKSDRHSWLMRGPFQDHASALTAVRETKDKACEIDGRAIWMAWGTARLGDEYVRADEGKMNQFFD